MLLKASMECPPRSGALQRQELGRARGGWKKGEEKKRDLANSRGGRRDAFRPGGHRLATHRKVCPGPKKRREIQLEIVPITHASTPRKEALSTFAIPLLVRDSCGHRGDWRFRGGAGVRSAG